MRSHCALGARIAGAFTVLIVSAPTCAGGVRSSVVEVVDAGAVDVGAVDASVLDPRADAHPAAMTSADASAAHRRT
jgi:hypothetical protein